MKKVMIGLLILIPILILLIVAAVTNFISTSAYIAVDDVVLYQRGTKQVADSITVVLGSDSKGSTYDIEELIDVDIMPKRANQYSKNWSISGNITCMDEEYEADYKAGKVGAPAMFVDDDGNEVTTGSTKILINTFCRFTLVLEVESFKRTLSFIAEGYDVKSITIVNVKENETNIMEVGQSMRLDAKYNPMSSRVSSAEWRSTNSNVVSVDGNGTVTAHGVGTAVITVKAYNRTDTENKHPVTSSEYAVTVNPSISKYGRQITVSKTEITFDEIGVNNGLVTGSSGCVVDTVAGKITMTADEAVLNLGQDNITITRCGENDIVIENAAIYDADTAKGGYVFEVGGPSLKLNAVWADMLKSGKPADVVWTSSDPSVAAVSAGGAVTAVSSGLTAITVTRAGSSASVYLNVQEKVVSMQLSTTDASLAEGIARETVFAAEKYIDVVGSNSKEPNSVLINIVGAPMYSAEKYGSAESYAAALAVFYSAYKFDVVSGSEYAAFDDSSVANKLVFKPYELKDKGKQTVKVRVVAKYPKYESALKYVTDEVNIQVVYGVQIENIAEFRMASEDQKAYAYAEGNYKDPTLYFEHNDVETETVYRLYHSDSSEHGYAICFARNANVAYEIDGSGRPVTVTENDSNRSVRVFGDVYGNNAMLSAEKGQLTTNASLIRIVWSDVTVSNLRLRANSIGDDGMISDTNGFSGKCFEIYNDNAYYGYFLNNVRIEYCIAENGRQIIKSLSTDLTIDGTIIRNVSTVSMYVPTRVGDYWDRMADGGNGSWVTGLCFTKLNINNCLYSNCLQSVGSFSYERVTLTDKGASRFVKIRENETAKEAAERNLRYYQDNFIAHGMNTSVNQTGFIDIYNWHNTNNASLLMLEGDGLKEVNDLISNFSGKILSTNSITENLRYWSEKDNAYYFHMGFLCTGISADKGIFAENTFLEVHFEDENMNADGISTRDLKEESEDRAIKLGERTIKGFSIQFFNYKNTASITPESTYTFNDELIRHLHGED